MSFHLPEPIRPNLANQVIEVRAAGDGSVNLEGMDLIVIIGDDDPVNTADGAPVFTTSSAVTGTVFETNNLLDGDPSGVVAPQAVFHSVITDSGFVPDTGLLATIWLDTTGITSGRFPLRFQLPPDDESALFFDFSNDETATFVDSEIRMLVVIPEPASAGMVLSLAAPAAWRRRDSRTGVWWT
ncbi:MAG: hypothetical protein AAF916_03485 [Planctomycetota bacterium]